ncbi:MAG: response regulator [Gemmatimonadetes bacterium]|nr:response regulator [Gemmatimonadota bacterium]
MTDVDRTILIVEDDELLRDAFKLLLEDAGYQVIEAGTAEAAIRLATERLPALVVLDLGLPDRPGLDVVRTLRKDPDMADLPVIALTGRVGPAEERECIAAGCDRYLPKPVAPADLLRELPALIRR